MEFKSETTVEEFLEEIVFETGQLLTEFARSEEFNSTLATSFGTEYDAVAAGDLQEALYTGAFLDGIEIEVLSNATLQGALGAYAGATNTIYLSQGLLDSSPETATAVLLEEVGHAIDEFLNDSDSPGDEGAIFSALVRGEVLSPETLAQLQEEDDSATLTRDVETVIVEQATDSIAPNESALRTAISSANAGDTITFNAPGTITLTSGQLEIDKALTIDGDLDDDGTPDITVDADGNSRVFNIDDNDSGSASAVSLEGLTITGGTVTGDGGGIFNREDLTLSNSTVSGNSAFDGGGIINFGTANLTGSTVSGNTTTGSFSNGGGIFNSGTANLTGSTVSGNSANDLGGGIYNRGTANLTGSTVSGNSATGSRSDGGGIYNSGTANLTGSTVSGNSAGDDGGGIYNIETANLTGSTVSGNSAEEDGGGIYNIETANLTNSLVAGNTATNSGNEIYSNDTVNADANNLFGDNSQSNGEAFSGFNRGSSDLTATSDGTNPTALPNILEVDVNGNPLLQDNGGATETIALAPNSPAINAGSNDATISLVESEFNFDLNNDGDTGDTITRPDEIAFDGRGDGFDRVFNGQVDIGAYEEQPPNEAPTDISLSSTTLNENVPENSTVGTFSTIDPNIGDSFTYSLVSGVGDSDNNLFTIDGDELKIDNSPDFESQDSYSIRVETEDSGGETFDETFTISVNDINETPTDISLSSSTINENVLANSVVGTFSTTDPDTGDTHTYSLVSGTGDTDNSAFTIDGDELKIDNSPDFETQGSYSIRVETKDSGGETFDEAFTISVNNLNDNSPTDIGITNLKVTENATANTLIGNLSTVDEDGVDSHTYSLVDDAGGRFTVNNGGLWVAADDVLDYETATTHQITVRTTDSGNLTFDKNLTVELKDGVDEITGTGGDIVSGPGGDTLTASANADNFIYEQLWSGADTIIGFDPAEDLMDVSTLFSTSRSDLAGNPNVPSDLFNSSTPFDDYLKVSPSGSSDTLVEFAPYALAAPSYFLPLATLENVNPADIDASNFAFS